MAYPYTQFGGFTNAPYQNPYAVNPNYQPTVNAPQMPLQGLSSSYTQQQVQQQGQQQFATNKIYVRNVDDAMNRQAAPNSEVIYVHQDLPMIIEVKTDGQGRKQAVEYDIKEHKQNAAESATEPQTNDFVTRAEYEKLFDQIRGIEKSLKEYTNRGEIIDE